MRIPFGFLKPFLELLALYHHFNVLRLKFCTRKYLLVEVRENLSLQELLRKNIEKFFPLFFPIEFKPFDKVLTDLGVGGETIFPNCMRLHLVVEHDHIQKIKRFYNILGHHLPNLLHRCCH